MMPVLKDKNNTYFVFKPCLKIYFPRYYQDFILDFFYYLIKKLALHQNYKCVL